MGQWWLSTGTGALAAAELGQAACGISPLGGGHHWSHHRATKQMTHKLQNNYTKEILALLRMFYDPQQISQPGDPAKALRNPMGFELSGQWELTRELPQDCGSRLFKDTNKSLCTPGARRKEQCSHKRLARLVCECSGVSSGGVEA